MRNKKGYEWLNTLAFLAMAGLCVYLNLFSKQAGTIANIIVNVAMFVIVGLILLVSDVRCFRPLDNMLGDLERVTGVIRKDAMNSHRFLWDQYRRDGGELFRDPVLKEQFADYVLEMDRIVRSDKDYYRCDIEDYVNYGLADTVLHRNQLNQVPGVMTGLGILGTFVGLSLGLQSFNTGSTAEITNSIAPLMDGIKVAFHTSIYGLVFSLIYNYVLKRKIAEAEKTVDRFIVAYKKYVLPDTATDGVNRLMQLQQQQTDAIRSLSDTVALQLSEGLAQLLEPQFDRFDHTIQSFGMMQTKNQLDALQVVVNAFIAEMNRSLNGSFTQMAYTIDQTYKTQRANAEQMTQILEQTGSTATNLTEIEKMTSRIVSTIGQYTQDVSRLQTEMSGNISDLRVQAEGNRLMLDQEKSYLNDLSRYRKALEESARAFGDQLRQQQEMLDDLRTSLVDLPNDVGDTFKVIDDNLVDVETHFRDTILEIKEATGQSTDMVADAYAGLERALTRAAHVVDDLNYAIDRIAQDQPGVFTPRTRR